MVAIAKGTLGVAFVALLVWFKWKQVKETYEKRDLGDGGIRTLFGSSAKSKQPTR